MLRGLGELENDVMRTLWRRGQPATVREVHERLSTTRSLAYTTVMTVMERLWRKGLLKREPRGRAFVYSPALSEAEYTAGLMHRLLGTSQNRREVLARFVQGMKRTDEVELLRLTGEAERKRKGTR